MNNEIVASCRCGNVKFTSTEKPVIQLCCHCNDCRKITSSDYTTIAFFDSATVFVSGNLSAAKFTAQSGNKTSREVCPECSCVMFDRSEGFPTLIGVVTEQISAPFKANPSHHVWVKSKLSHVSIPPEVKEFDEGIS